MRDPVGRQDLAAGQFRSSYLFESQALQQSGASRSDFSHLFQEEQNVSPAPMQAPRAAAAAPPMAPAGMAPMGAPGGVPYFPRSVQAAWDNHFDAFGKQDLDKIMLDYDDTSVAKVYNNKDGSKSEFVGRVQIRNMFTNLFSDLSNLDTLKAPVVDVDEAGKTVFLVWECPGSGYHFGTDTFVFGPDNKIKRQNIVVTKGSPEKDKKSKKNKKQSYSIC
ncbi:casB [Symbiodinium natans]|uniref:CasB protein n=1 Tax=Symbiodinium natans TaxID=878477 RepID=A0A812STE6_9DINO|nr:casB [Symbiodinium natans]